MIHQFASSHAGVVLHHCNVYIHTALHYGSAFSSVWKSLQGMHHISTFCPQPTYLVCNLLFQKELELFQGGLLGEIGEAKRVCEGKCSRYLTKLKYILNHAAISLLPICHSPSSFPCALPSQLAESMKSPSLWLICTSSGALSKSEKLLLHMNELKEYYYTWQPALQYSVSLMSKQIRWAVKQMQVELFKRLRTVSASLAAAEFRRLSVLPTLTCLMV